MNDSIDKHVQYNDSLSSDFHIVVYNSIYIYNVTSNRNTWIPRHYSGKLFQDSKKQNKYIFSNIYSLYKQIYIFLSRKLFQDSWKLGKYSRIYIYKRIYVYIIQEIIPEFQEIIPGFQNTNPKFQKTRNIFLENISRKQGYT